MSLRKLHNALLGKSFAMLPHAMERWIERGRGDLADEFERAVPFGAQYGNDVLLLSPGGAVFACKRENTVVTTVLTKEQAVANTERHNRGLHRLYGSVCVPANAAEIVERNRILAAEERVAGIQSLAKEWFDRGGNTGKQANRFLREAGYEPSGKDGGLFRSTLQKLWRDHYTKVREARQLAASRSESQGV